MTSNEVQHVYPYPQGVIDSGLTEQWDATGPIHEGDEAKFMEWLDKVLAYFQRHEKERNLDNGS